MKSPILHALRTALDALHEQGHLPAEALDALHLERTRERQHGDFASNTAMTLAKTLRLKPRNLADQIIRALPTIPLLRKVEIAGPGFINFYLSSHAYFTVLNAALTQKTAFGETTAVGQGQTVQIEYVSANPTGPLHVGHGRGAAFGASLANILRATGFVVQQEYYVNDGGRQMDILAASLYLRFAESQGAKFSFPRNGYRGEYVKEIAEELADLLPQHVLVDLEDLFRVIPPDEGSEDAENGENGDKEAHIDGVIAELKTRLGDETYATVFNLGLQRILDDIRDDLAEFGVHFDRWYSEKSLSEAGALQAGVAALENSGYLYEAEGAKWFRSTAFGDEKDRVVVRENGQTTYFASDIAYHKEKFERGFASVIDIWGADHHGYIPRVKAALTALNLDANRLIVQLIQFVRLLRDNQPVSMSTRSGEFVTLRELRQEVGNDAARFFYVSRNADQRLDFDLEVAKRQSKDNPVYYIQYAHARICRIFDEAQKQFGLSPNFSTAPWHLLTHELEEGLMVQIARYSEVLEATALQRQPHLLAQYLLDLATELHRYYDFKPRIVVLCDDPELRLARLGLCLALRQVLVNSLTLIGVTAPETM